MLTSQGIKEACRAIGFEHAGVCRADPPESIEVLDTWLAAGMHGEMEYMQRHRDARANLEAVLPGVRSVVMVGLVYNQRRPEAKGQPKIAKYALGRDYHKVMRAKLKELESRLAEAAPAAHFRACVDSAPVMERELAQRAGIGWFGKNTCLIDSRTGSWFLIGALLTDLDLDADEAAVGGCGTCRACVDSCPTGAIVNHQGVWNVDARRCISYLTIEKRGDFSQEEAKMIGDWTFGCDVCQDVCPFNQPRESQPARAPQTRDLGLQQLRVWPSLKDLADISREDWDKLTAGSPVRRAGWEGLKRNAQANLDNAETEA